MSPHAGLRPHGDFVPDRNITALRVLLLGPFPPPHGGVQTNLVAIRNFLRKRGIACGVINITRTRRPDADEVYYPNNALALLKRLIGLRYDVVHLHIGGNLTSRLLALGLICCWMPGKRAVLTLHSGGYPSSPAGRATGFWSWLGFALRRFDRLIAVNSEIALFFEKCGAEKSRIRMIPPHAFQTPAGELPGELREFFESHQPTLLTVGLLEPEYDLPLQIEALGQVRERFPNAGLVIIGSGSLEAELRARIAAIPDAAHVLLCGDVAHAATLRAIEQCDVFLRTTLYDGDAVSVREALHFGVPVIATDNGMRPAGCDLITPSDKKLLLAAIEQRLRQPRNSLRLPDPVDGDENLEAVLTVYREIVSG